MSNEDLANTVGLADERFVPGTHRGELMEAEHYARYWWASALVADRRVLDAGCGVGYGARILSGGLASQVVGVDISGAAIAAATQFESPTVRFERGDVHALDFEDGAFDVAVCFEVIEHVDRREEVLTELRRVLTPDGVLVISSPNRGVYPSGNPHHVFEYQPDELAATLTNLFRNVALRRQQYWLASAILDDDQLRHVDHRVAISGLESTKVHRVEPNAEIYTLAIASDGPVPTPQARSVWTGLDEPNAWFAEIRALRDDNGQLAAELSAARANVAALKKERDALIAIERGLRDDAARLIEQLRTAQSSLHRLYTSLSWRMTQPLRDAARVVRRISRRGAR